MVSSGKFFDFETAPKRGIKTDGFRNGEFSAPETPALWCPFVLVPIGLLQKREGERTAMRKTRETKRRESE